MTSLPPISESLPDAPPLPAFHQVRSLKAGLLTKQGSLFKSWKRRLFILQDAFLLYYVSAEDTSPRGALWIKECVVREETDVSRLQSAKSGQPTYCFSLLCHKSWNIEAKRVFKERTYLLLADSFQDMSDWIAILRTMSRASADIDAEFEQSYAAFAAMPSGAITISGTNSADHSAQNATLRSASASLEGAPGRTAKHNRHKSKSGSGGCAGSSIYSGAHARSASITAHQTQLSDGSGFSGSVARPRTRLASSGGQSLSSSAAASSIFFQRAGTTRTPPLGSSVGGAGAAGTGDGHSSLTGGTSFSTGTGTPRASISHSLSESRNSLTQNSVTQRRRVDTDDDTDGGGTGEHTPRAIAHPAAASAAFPTHPHAASHRPRHSTSPPTTTAHSLSSLHSHHSPSSSIDVDAAARGDDPEHDGPARSITPLAGQQHTLTPRQHKQPAAATPVAAHTVAATAAAVGSQ